LEDQLIRQKAVYICDTCGKEIDEETMISTHDVQDEGSSSIMYKGKELEIGGQHFCNLKCLMQFIAKGLNLD
jgi:DNA-directed RNA polymerase subunit RPC12/RpoP